jgi:hypothetical protein
MSVCIACKLHSVDDEPALVCNCLIHGRLQLRNATYLRLRNFELNSLTDKVLLSMRLLVLITLERKLNSSVTSQWRTVPLEEIPVVSQEF